MSWTRVVKAVLLGAVLVAGRTGAQGAAPETPPTPTEPAPSDAPRADSGREVNVEAGYPGVFAEYVGTLQPTFELGGRFTFNYGYEGDIQKYAPGIKLQAILVFILPPLGPFTPSVRVEPGLYTYFFSQPGTTPLRSGPGPGPLALTAPGVPHGGTRQELPPDSGYGSSSSGDEGASLYGTVYGTVIPVFYQMNFPVVPRWAGRVAIGVAPNITFGNGNGGFILPIQVGAGMSYELQPNLDLRVDLAVGPRIYLGSGTNLSYDFWVGLGWHL